ncbi:YoaK family protein [Streptomyces sp. NPDC086077]|uniref:YoaK family protein n=1 Tax=Streptomyces sp. NPDC086077 TaxID=3154862 RepID=UPI003439DA8F
MNTSHDAAPTQVLDLTGQVLLTTTAGCVNTVGYLALGGVFTSVMTANLALLGLASGVGDPSVARLAALAILAYWAGTAVGSKVAVSSFRRRPDAMGLKGALAVETLVLWSVSVTWMIVDGEPGSVQRAVLLAASALAMGCQGGGVRVATRGAASTSYLTGAMTSVIAELVQNRRFDRNVALIIVCMPVGAALGGMAIRWARLTAPGIAALLATVALLLVARRSGRRSSRRP